jgi:capsule polysaccharide export protein KpsE/RkpR
MEDPVVRALRENTDAFGTVQKRYRLVWVAIILVVIALALAARARHTSAVESCRRTNVTRAEVNKKFDVLADAVAAEGVVRIGVEDVLREHIPMANCRNLAWL